MGKLFKVLIWGKNAVGKTSLIEQLAYGRVEDKVRIIFLLFILDLFFSFSHTEKQLKIRTVYNMIIV
jgi:GTPase SAR1 family protein